MVRIDALARQIGEGRVWLRYALAAGLGAVAALGQAPWGLWPLTIIALAVIFGLWRETRGWVSATLLGLIAGTGHFVVALSWIFEPFLVDAARHGWMAPFAVLGLSVFMASDWAVAVGAARALAPRSGVALVGAFVICEALRGWLFTGFAWAQVGHVLIRPGLRRMRLQKIVQTGGEKLSVDMVQPLGLRRQHVEPDPAVAAAAPDLCCAHRHAPRGPVQFGPGAEPLRGQIAPIGAQMIGAGGLHGDQRLVVSLDMRRRGRQHLEHGAAGRLQRGRAKRTWVMRAQQKMRGL